jgi:hypothetical protein
MKNPTTPPKPTHADKPTSKPATTSAFAAAVLARGGRVHVIDDGAGGYFEVAIINPGALRPKNQGGEIK